MNIASSQTLTNEDQIQLINEFEQLKKTARHVEDVCSWFKGHPFLIPGLPAEYFDKVNINLEAWNSGADFFDNTKITTYRFQAWVSQEDVKSNHSVLHRITGLIFEDIKDVHNAFSKEFEVKFDARFWRFLAVAELSDLTVEELERPSRNSVYRNIMESHFPHVKWSTVLNLLHTDIFPNTVEGFELMVQQSASTHLDTLPTNLAP